MRDQPPDVVVGLLKLNSHSLQIVQVDQFFRYDLVVCNIYITIAAKIFISQYLAMINDNYYLPGREL
jgi:hypothetical protein